MEINPHHSIIKELRRKADTDQNDKTVKDLVMLLFDTALLTSGFNLEDPSSYGERIHRMVKLGLSIDDDELPPAPVAASSEMDADDLAEGEGRMQEVD